MQQVIDGWDSDGPCTALGQSRALDAAGAALVNGVAIHGEDFDDTLEGAPIRVGAMVIPAVLAAAEHHGLSGARKSALSGKSGSVRVVLGGSRTIKKKTHHN